jgi:hypothetical protein
MPAVPHGYTRVGAIHGPRRRVWRCRDAGNDRETVVDEEERVTREQLLENLRWLAEGNPQYAGTDEEGRQNPEVARLMAEDFLLSYVDDEEVTELFCKLRAGARREA